MTTPKRGLPRGERSRRGFLSRAAALVPGALAHLFLRLASAEPFPGPADSFLRLSLAQSARQPTRTASTAENPAGAIRFELAPASCGLDFVLRNGAQGRKYQVETLPGGLGVIDFD